MSRKISKKRAYKENSFKKNLFLFMLAIGILLVISIIAKKTDTRIQQVASLDPQKSLQIGTFLPEKQNIPQPDQPENKTSENPKNTPTPTGFSCNPTFDPISNDCPCPLGEPTHKFCDTYAKTGALGGVCTTDSDCPATKGKVCDFSNFDPTSGQQPLCDEVNVPAGRCVDFCGAYDKPILYLYPERETYVDVAILTTGNIFKSIPQYPEGGWKKIFAYPDGKLIYQGKTYQELFYETNIGYIEEPQRGLTLTSQNLEKELDAILYKLGLNSWERNEFLTYWIPRLKKENTQYFQFSLIQGDFKEKTDKLLITPKPDTLIEILVYFKPLKKPYTGKALQLPSEPPKRIGFTAVEWGGTLQKY